MFVQLLFVPGYTGLTWLSLETQWLPEVRFCICQSWENVEQSWAERFPLLRRDLWRILRGRGVLWLEEKYFLPCWMQQIELFCIWGKKKKSVWIIRVLCIYMIEITWEVISLIKFDVSADVPCSRGVRNVQHAVISLPELCKWFFWLVSLYCRAGVEAAVVSGCSPQGQVSWSSHPSVSAFSWPGILACNLLQGIKEWI